MYAIITLLVVFTLSLVITRIASVALMMTGLSRDVARFQARSAFTGVGFPTQEAETVMRHPVRRQIIMTLMLLNNVGLATVIATIVIGALDAQKGTVNWGLNLTVLFAGLTLLWATFTNPWIDRQTSKVIAWMLARFTDLEIQDYAALLHLSSDYAVLELKIEAGHWLVNKTLAELKLPAEGILILGIERSTNSDGATFSPRVTAGVSGRSRGFYVGVPHGGTRLLANDLLILYGPLDRIRELDRRRKDLAGYLAQLRARTDREKRIEPQPSSVQQPQDPQDPSHPDRTPGNTASLEPSETSPLPTIEQTTRA